MTDTKNQRWKTGDELLPFHPDASHVSPDFRDGWNACYAVGSMNLKPSGTEALKEAIEGECDGLAITDEQANNILLFVFGQASVRTPKPLDDPRLQELFGSAISGALAFGAQGTNKPPEGHWLMPFWEMARAERDVNQTNLFSIRNVTQSWHERAVALGYDGVADVLHAAEVAGKRGAFAVVGKASAAAQKEMNSDVLWEMAIEECNATERINDDGMSIGMHFRGRNGLLRFAVLVIDRTDAERAARSVPPEVDSMKSACDAETAKHRIEVRANEDGSLDEVVGVGQFHLEQMDDNLWWLRVEAAGRAVVVWLRSKRKIVATSEEETISTPAGKDEPRRTGAAPGMLQDDDRGLSSWLANQPDARRLARDAAETVAADSKPSHGWRLVPPEPTPEMLVAGERALFIPPGDARSLDARRTWADQCCDVYRAMLAAARTVPISLTPPEARMVAWFNAFTKDRCDCFFDTSLVRAWIEDLRAGRPYVPGPGAEPQTEGLTDELIASGFADASSMHSTIPRMCEDYFRQGAAFAMRTFGPAPTATGDSI